MGEDLDLWRLAAGLGLLERLLVSLAEDLNAVDGFHEWSNGS